MQPESFELGPKIGKPNAKLGAVIDYIPVFLKEGLDIEDAIRKASKKADYYVNQIESKIESIKSTWEEYSPKLNALEPTDKERLIVSDKDYETVKGCLDSCYQNQEIMQKLRPTDVFGDPIESYCEDAFFANYIVTYQDKQCAVIPFKAKFDNWTIDFDSKILTLNDLKTTGHPVQGFMRENGSWHHFSYARQMACYSELLYYYAMKEFGVTYKQGWQLKANMLVVETIPNYWSRSFYVTKEQLTEGKLMFRKLMSMVGYYTIFGFDKEVTFE